MAKNLKNPINYSVQLDEDQKIVKEAIMNNQIVVVTGLHYLKKLSNVISEIKWFSLKNNHRSDLVSKILDFEYSNKKSE